MGVFLVIGSPVVKEPEPIFTGQENGKSSATF